ncbi:MAG TPA: ABC transporter ATP-binding protein [Thermodesulfobacteriaceae bacterium]|nr:ABC transporter ATP-binding protein [Thermodesulfobacteriaceae bacterium]
MRDERNCPMSQGNAVELTDVSKSFRLYQSPADRLKEAFHPFKRRYHTDFFAIKGISIAIPRGESWGIIGFNGSGKSTLLKVICGILQPTRGQVRVAGEISALLELGSGFNPEFTGRQNVFFAGALAGKGKREMERRFDEIVEFAAIGDFIDQPVKNYSSGMMVRLAFAVATNISPDILVIDEALSVGDAPFQHKSMAKIKSFQGDCTIIFVSHDLNAVLTLCDRVIWLHQGRIVQTGPPREIIKHYTEAMYEGVDESGHSDGESAGAELPETADVQERPGNFQSFGRGGAKILRTELISCSRGAVESVFGGEEVAVEVMIETFETIERPIVGFTVKNRLGMEIFGYNNLTVEKDCPQFPGGEKVMVSFRFIWPHLVAGSYAITVAVADGTLEDHVQHHWIHDLLLVNCVQTIRLVGLVGLGQADFKVKIGK